MCCAQATAEPSLLTCGLWCIGEFGEMLLPTAGQPLIDKEPPLKCSEKEVVDLLTTILSRKHLDLRVRCVGNAGGRSGGQCRRQGWWACRARPPAGKEAPCRLVGWVWAVHDVRLCVCLCMHVCLCTLRALGAARGAEHA